MPNCPYCKSLRIRKFDEGTLASGDFYQLYECVECSVQFWTPFKNPGAEWYEKDFLYSGRNSDPPSKPNWNHLQIIKFFEGKKIGKVLDVGCGTGNFLTWAKKNGWQVYGLDFDREAIFVAKNKFNLENVLSGDLSDYLASNSLPSFDLITFFDVLEHVDNPNVFIEQIRQILKPGGFIALSVPNRKGSRWIQTHDLPPRHLTRWDKYSLKSFLNHHGFFVIEATETPVSLFSLVVKLRLRYGRLFSFGAMQKTKKIVTRQDSSWIVKSSGGTTMRVVHLFAKIKDVFLFGFPGLIIWLALGSRRRTGLFFIAQKS